MQNLVFNRDEFSVLLYQLNTLLEQQRHIKKTLLAYLEKISAYINNSNSPENTATITPRLADVQDIFENIKNIIDKILELKQFLENVSNSSSSNVITFEKYYETQLELEKQIYKNNDLYKSFIENTKSFINLDLSDLDFSIPEAFFITDDLENRGKTQTEEEYFDESSAVEDVTISSEIVEETNPSIDDTINTNNNEENVLEKTTENSESLELVENSEETPFLEDTPVIEENPILISDISKETSNNNSAPFMEDTIVENDFEEEPSLLESSDNSINDNSDSEIPDGVLEETATTPIEETKKTQNEETTDSTETSTAFMEDTIVAEELSQEPPIEIEEQDTPVVAEVEEETSLVEKTLFINEYNNTAILPYSILDLEEYFSDNPEKYSSLHDIIDQEYTVSLNNYVNNSITRFKETYRLAKSKSNLSVLESLNFAKKVFKIDNVQPVVIAACSSIDELSSYIDCLENNKLNSFEYFKIINQ